VLICPGDQSAGEEGSKLAAYPSDLWRSLEASAVHIPLIISTTQRVFSLHFSTSFTLRPHFSTPFPKFWRNFNSKKGCTVRLGFESAEYLLYCSFRLRQFPNLQLSMAAEDVDEGNFSDASDMTELSEFDESSPKLVPVLLKAYQPLVHIFQATTRTLFLRTIQSA